MDLKSNNSKQTNKNENKKNYIFSNKSKENIIESESYIKTEEINEEKEMEEEEEINSDEYVSSSMLDVETNTYINHSLINISNKNIINEREKDFKIKKIEKKGKNVINIYSKKENNQKIKKDDNNSKILTLEQSSMIPLNRLLENNIGDINYSIKDNNKNIFIKSNEENLTYNSNILNNNIIKSKKENKIDDNKINNNRVNINDFIKKNNSVIENKSNQININKINKYNLKNNNKKDNSRDEYSNCLFNENILKDLLILKKGKNYKILKNSKSIKLEKTRGRLSTSPKIESLYKNINKSNINLDILRKLKKNYSNNIIDDNTINNNYKINANSKIYIKKIPKYIITKENDSPLKKLKINTSASLNNKKVDFLKNNKINEDIINFIQNKKLQNNKKNQSKSKSKSKSIGKENNMILKKDNNKNIYSKQLKILKYFNSFHQKKEKKIFKNMTNEQFLTYSNNNNNMTHNNSGIANKSIDAKKIYELSKKYKFRIKQRRNLSTDIDYISNIIPEKLNKLSCKNELKEQFLSNIMKKKDYLSNRSQHKGFNNNIKNNSKFNLRNNLLLNDHAINYIISKANKNVINKSKYDTKSLFDGYLLSNNKINNENAIYKKIMKNFYNYGRNKNINSNVHFQNVYGKNSSTRRTEYKQNYKNNNTNYNINNNISNNFNNININTSNNLINVITNITTNNEYQSLSNKKSNIKHNLTNNLINHYIIQNQKFKRDLGPQLIDNTIRLNTVDANYNKKINLDKNNNNYLKNKFVKNNQKNEIGNNNNVKNNKNLQKKNVIKHQKNSLSFQNNNILNNNKFLINKLNKIHNTSESLRQSSNDKKDNKIYIKNINTIDKKGKISNLNSERNNYKTKFKITKYKYINEQNDENKKIKK